MRTRALPSSSPTLQYTSDPTWPCAWAPCTCRRPRPRRGRRRGTSFPPASRSRRNWPRALYSRTVNFCVSPGLSSDVVRRDCTSVAGLVVGRPALRLPAPAAGRPSASTSFGADAVHRVGRRQIDAAVRDDRRAVDLVVRRAAACEPPRAPSPLGLRARTRCRVRCRGRPCRRRTAACCA